MFGCLLIQMADKICICFSALGGIKNNFYTIASPRDTSDILTSVIEKVNLVGRFINRMTLFIYTNGITCLNVRPIFRDTANTNCFYTTHDLDWPAQRFERSMNRS